MLTPIESLHQDTLAWFSFTLRDSMHLSDGTDLAHIVPNLNASSRVVAIGVNCIRPRLVASSLAYLATLTAKPLIAYPNSGEDWNAEAKSWKKSSDSMDDLVSMAPVWRSYGAKIIGGCCRTSPEQTARLRKVFPVVKARGL